MQRLEFGVLIAILRTELGWTQAQLAEYAEIEIATLSNIERGAKKYLEPDLLFRLANALQLTSLERREFFLASCGIDQEHIVRQPNPITPTSIFNSQNLLDRLIEATSNIYAPAFLGDSFGDILAVNHAFLELLEINSDLVESITKNGTRVNYLQVIFDSDTRESISKNINGFDLTLLRAFREGSFRYRTKRRYRDIMRELRNIKKYPSFDRYWRRVSTLEEDKASMLDPITINHESYGELRFQISSSITLSPHGEMFLVHYFPIDIHTAQAVIEIIKKVGAKAVRLSSWPQKD